jgi:hypothetical protein
VAQQGPPPRRPARPAAPGWPEQPAARRRAAHYSGPDPDLDEDLDDDDLPPWAGLSITPRRPGREYRPPREHRPPQEPRRPRDARPPGQGRQSPSPRWAERQPPDADAYEDTGDDGTFGPARSGGGWRPRRAVVTRARKARRKIYIWGGVALAAAFTAFGVITIVRPAAPAPRHDGFVTTYQPGDFRAVPNACHAIPVATLGQYLPGAWSRAVSASLGGSRTESQCTWTLDASPLFRVLEVTAQAFAPSLLATGNGSATFSAMDSFGAARQALADPPKATHKPKATVTQLSGLGSAAFSALQVLHDGRGRTDLVTLVVRVRNALVTVAFQGLDHSARGGYGPVSVPQLRAGALAAAREVIARLR